MSLEQGFPSGKARGCNMTSLTSDIPHGAPSPAQAGADFSRLLGAFVSRVAIFIKPRSFSKGRARCELSGTKARGDLGLKHVCAGIHWRSERPTQPPQRGGFFCILDETNIMASRLYTGQLVPLSGLSREARHLPARWRGCVGRS